MSNLIQHIPIHSYKCITTFLKIPHKLERLISLDFTKDKHQFTSLTQNQTYTVK